MTRGRLEATSRDRLQVASTDMTGKGKGKGKGKSVVEQRYSEVRTQCLKPTSLEWTIGGSKEQCGRRRLE